MCIRDSSYVVLFDYGSVIFLHFNEHQQEVGGIGSSRRGSGRQTGSGANYIGVFREEIGSV